jgi:hypothetical protein
MSDIPKQLQMPPYHFQKPQFGTVCSPAHDDEGKAEEYGDKIDALESELRAIVEAVARRSRGLAHVESLYEYVSMNWPTLWERFGGITPETPSQAESKALGRAMEKLK